MKKLAILIIAATVLSGCSAYQYYSVNTRVDLSKYRSFAWLRGDGSQAERYYDNDIATEKIIDAVNLELTDRGLQLDKDKPDHTRLL